MASIISLTFIFGLAMLIGGMVFFPSVVAPRIFKSLNETNAGQFLRALFPAYYMFVVATSGVAAVAAIFINAVYAVGLSSITVTTLAVRELLMPQLNVWRDQSLLGDVDAGRKFNSGHRLSVVVNMVQLIVAFTIIAHWTLANTA
ncbi:MAG: DUF4149 domain-containing protein [Pseudomonadota bacterium]